MMHSNSLIDRLPEHVLGKHPAIFFSKKGFTINTVKTVSKFTSFYRFESRFIVLNFQINIFFHLSVHRFIISW